MAISGARVGTAVWLRRRSGDHDGGLSSISKGDDTSAALGVKELDR
jgi:hypothetical protein